MVRWELLFSGGFSEYVWLVSIVCLLYWRWRAGSMVLGRFWAVIRFTKVDWFSGLSSFLECCPVCLFDLYWRVVFYGRGLFWFCSRLISGICGFFRWIKREWFFVNFGWLFLLGCRLHWFLFICLLGKGFVLWSTFGLVLLRFLFLGSGCGPGLRLLLCNLAIVFRGTLAGLGGSVLGGTRRGYLLILFSCPGSLFC